MRDDANGFVLLYRSLLGHKAFRNDGEAMFFAWLIVKAVWKDTPWRYDERLYQLRRGDLVMGAREMAKRFGWSHKRVRTVMRQLVDGNMIGLNWTQHGAQRAPIVTINNYSDFQISPNGSAQGSAQDGHKVGTPKKEGNKEEYGEAPSPAAPRKPEKRIDQWANILSAAQRIDRSAAFSIIGQCRKKYPDHIIEQAIARYQVVAENEGVAEPRSFMFGILKDLSTKSPRAGAAAI